MIAAPEDRKRGTRSNARNGHKIASRALLIFFVFGCAHFEGAAQHESATIPPLGPPITRECGDFKLSNYQEWQVKIEGSIDETYRFYRSDNTLSTSEFVVDGLRDNCRMHISARAVSILSTRVAALTSFETGEFSTTPDLRAWFDASGVDPLLENSLIYLLILTGSGAEITLHEVLLSPEGILASSASR